ncbi:sulfatase-like hydrolase/transferase [Haloarcula argentinensis]|uniref:Sulfatase-like hydrolase/transferase n=1 Tax=Haloarcula argentinensis TaxID=43776 RepID=A0A847ULC2_HALAR|nr:sulfatase-like hydrolase/transferase [Haloarcula argentinensis]NLV11948.1 sulfatase-like hydrolase/transferase [Haloarcula argentinensis]
MATVKNAYVFVADALRWDHLPDRLHEIGDVKKTVASSTLSPTSFASITSGLYPPHHGVKTFSHQVRSDRNWMLEAETHNTSFWQSSSDDPIYDVLNQNPSEKKRVDDIEAPFINIERELLTHAPYGVSEDETGANSNASSFINKESIEITGLRKKYSHGVERAVSTFEERLASLNDRDILDETLIIFTSDHGELLGEYGTFSHTSPLVPELVYVPTVFIHPNGVNPEMDGILSHIDISTTIADVLDIEIPYRTSGMSAYSDTTRKGAYAGFEFPPNYGAFGESTSFKYRYHNRVDSIWDVDGGWSFRDPQYIAKIQKFLKHMTPTSVRLRNTLRQNPYAILKLSKILLRNDNKFGSPKFSKEFAQDKIDEICAKSKTGSIHNDFDQIQKDRLRDLGYLD